MAGLFFALSGLFLGLSPPLQGPSIGPILLSFCLSFVSFRRADFILTVGVLSVFGSTRVWDPGNRENVSTLDSSGIAGPINSRNIR